MLKSRNIFLPKIIIAFCICTNNFVIVYDEKNKAKRLNRELIRADSSDYSSYFKLGDVSKVKNI